MGWGRKGWGIQLGFEPVSNHNVSTPGHSKRPDQLVDLFNQIRIHSFPPQIPDSPRGFWVILQLIKVTTSVQTGASKCSNKGVRVCGESTCGLVMEEAIMGAQHRLLGHNTPAILGGC